MAGLWVELAGLQSYSVNVALYDYASSPSPRFSYRRDFYGIGPRASLLQHRAMRTAVFHGMKTQFWGKLLIFHRRPRRLICFFQAHSGGRVAAAQCAASQLLREPT